MSGRQHHKRVRLLTYPSEVLSSSKAVSAASLAGGSPRNIPCSDTASFSGRRDGRSREVRLGLEGDLDHIGAVPPRISSRPDPDEPLTSPSWSAALRVP